jgi:hypothetical protein
MTDIVASSRQRFHIREIISKPPGRNSSAFYFCATNCLALLNSGRVEFDPSQTFNSSA